MKTLEKLALATLVLPSFAFAATSTTTTHTGFYGELGMGVSIPTDKDMDYHTNSDVSSQYALHMNNDWSNAFSYQAIAGYTFASLPYLSVETTLIHNAGSDIKTGTWGQLWDGATESNDTTYTGKFRIRNTAVLVGAKVDFATLFNQDWYGFHPYAGLGIGASRNTISDLEVDKGDGTTTTNATSRRATTFAWQAKVGVEYYFTDNIAADLEYAYNDYGKIKTSSTNIVGSESIDYRAQQVMMNLKYSF